MGVNVLNNLSTQEVRMPTGATGVSSGDLVLNTDSGYVVSASTALSLASNNVTTQGLSAIYAATAVVSTQYGYFTSNITNPGMDQFASGVIATAYPGNGSTSTTRLNLAYYSVTGVPVIPAITVSNDASINMICVRRVTNTTVAVAWQSSTTLKFAIYDNNGSVIKAATTVATTSVASSARCAFNVLANGSLVFAYNKVTSLDVAFSIYNSTGTQIGSEVIVEAAANSSLTNVTPLANGNFVVYYYRSATTAAYKFARYNSTGTLQGSLTTITASNNGAIYGYNDNLCVELQNGNLVFCAQSNSGTANLPYYYIYNSSGTLVTQLLYPYPTVTPSIAYTFDQCIPAITASSEGFIVASWGNSYVGIISIFTPSGGLLSTKPITSSLSPVNMNTEANYTSKITSLGNAGLLISSTYTFSSCGTTYYAVSKVINPYTIAAIGGQVTFFSSGNAGANFTALPTLDGSVMYSYGSQAGSNSFYIGTYSSQRKSVIGVAQESALANSSCRVGTVGTYALGNSYNGGTFDQRTAAVPGSKGTIVGNTAVLFGLN